MINNSITIPSSRWGFSLVEHEGKMILFGGVGTVRLNDLWELNLENYTWSSKSLGGDASSTQPAKRSYYLAVEYNGKMIIFGGWDDAVAKNDLWELDLSTYTWNQISAGGTESSSQPRTRRGLDYHSSVLLHNNLIMIGGGSNDYLNDVWKLDLSTYSWSQISAGGASSSTQPSARREHSVVVYAGDVIVFGGDIGASNPTDDVWVINTACFFSATGDVQITSDCILYSQIVVTGSLNITGIPDAHGVLPKIIGGGSNRLFKVQSGGELVVKYLNLTGGYISSEPYGGAIFVHGSGSKLHALGTIFENNKAIGTGGNAGAIYISDGAQFDTIDCFFLHNEALFGGAINIRIDSIGKIHNSTFKGNIADSRGGAIFVDSANLLLSGVIVSENIQKSASANGNYGGGGLYVKRSAVLQIQDSSIMLNEAVNSLRGHQLMTYRGASASDVPSLK